MKLIAGVDEVGRGPLAGPVISCAVILPENHNIIGLKDSKKLSKKKREELYPIIIGAAVSYGIGIVSARIIDKINIREATIMSMNLALKNLSIRPDFAYIDGERLINQKIPNEGIIGGDDLIDSIKSASIIAKVTRDKIMKKYSIIFPYYDFENNAGYGTNKHMNALHRYKSSPIHRVSFKPVLKNLATVSWYKNNKLENILSVQLVGLELINKGYNIIKMNSNKIINHSIHLIGEKDKTIYFFYVKKRLNKNNFTLNSSNRKELVTKLQCESEKFLSKSNSLIRYKFMLGLITLFDKNPKIRFSEIIT